MSTIMNKYQLIRAAEGLEQSLNIIRDQIIEEIYNAASRAGGELDVTINPMQFIRGVPHTVNGVRVVSEYRVELLLMNVDPIPLEEASTPVLTSILERID